MWLQRSCRPDRYSFGLSVGWSPTEEQYVHRLGLKENPPIYPNDGSLRRIRTLERVRQFELDEMSRPVSTLYLPFQEYRLESTPADQLRELMLREIEEYAFPYLSLMLDSRHARKISEQELGSVGEL